MNRITMVIAISIMLLLYGTGFYYVGRKIFRALYLIVPANSGGIHTKIFLGICILFVLSIALAFLPLDTGIKKISVWFAWFLMGLYIYFLLGFLLSDLVLLAGKLLRVIPSPTPQKFIAAAAWIVLNLTVLMAAYGIYNAKQIKQVSYTVQIEKESSLKSLKIILIADLHLWYVNDEKWLAKVVDNINILEPDIVCMAGDIFNDNFRALSNPSAAVRSLQSIRSKYGVYACFGNHDGGKTLDEMLHFLESSNVKLLQDEYAVIEDKFIIVGRKDSSPIGNQGEARKEFRFVMEGIEALQEAPLPIIVMDHNPANIKEYNNKVDLILAGHTHRGQMFPANIITRLMYDVHYGHYHSPHVIVTSGAGVWGPPLRIGTNNEIVSVLVKFENGKSTLIH